MNCYKSESGGQFFKIEGMSVKVVSLFDFNPVIERRRLSPDILTKLKCQPCTEQEFNEAQAKAMTLLDLPALIPA